MSGKTVSMTAAWGFFGVLCTLLLPGASAKTGQEQKQNHEGTTLKFLIAEIKLGCVAV